VPAAAAARRRAAWSQDSVVHLTARIAGASLPEAGRQVRKTGEGPSTHEMEGPARSRSPDAASSRPASLLLDPPPSRIPA
jgi:hypothetical protein